MDGEKPDKSRRDFLKFLACIGLGAAGAEVYERLYNIPLLERRFRKEVNHWTTLYNSAREELIHQDELEKESTSAISFYQQRMGEAIEGLKNAIEKYRAILGDERVAFESSSLKVLEDLKITQEKLLKVLPYFPLIKDLSWHPSKVVNDKVHDLNVSLEVISPLNTLEEVEISLIPVRYDYFITEYGMKAEDYDKAFPKEGDRTIKLKAKGLEREMFSVDFTDLKGGKEYLTKAVAKDVAGSVRKDGIKTPYIGEFENLGKLLYDKEVIIGTSYYEYYPDPVPWKVVTPRVVNPLLGRYDVRDTIIIAKHIDWATGHGINCFFLSWGWDDEINHKKYHDNIVNLVSSPLINQLHIAVQYEISRVWFHGVPKDEYGMLHLDDPEKWKGVVEDFKVLNTSFFNKENFLKIKGKPVVYWYNGDALVGKLGDFLDEIRSTYNNGIFILSDHAHPRDLHPSEERLNNAKEFDGWSIWAAGWCWGWYHDEPRNETFPKALEVGYKFWNEMAKKYEKAFMPSVIPGFVELRDPDWVAGGWNLPRDVGMFSKELDIAIKYATPIDGKKFIKIDTWNDFGEGTAIEPTIEEEYQFLEVIKKFAISYLEQ